MLARGEVVGASDLPYLDDGMGIATGLFLPNERYIDIQPTILAHMLADGSLGNDDPVALERTRENIKNLDMTIQSAEGEHLESELIFIADFSEELEKDGLEIHVLGLSREARQKFWPHN
ncbi:hypothetical protein EON83_00490 [bacterium]|nr:MAG: hypothetical protein EON83_00490 [bacterium]